MGTLYISLCEFVAGVKIMITADLLVAIAFGIVFLVFSAGIYFFNNLDE
jgi:hypothetical protein|tara:strand:+ start:285 stop:431 length:147 start_codon:yes stop_codon:yes gene_type:complete